MMTMTMMVMMMMVTLPSINHGTYPDDGERA
jgi:hypothetical protein